MTRSLCPPSVVVVLVCGGHYVHLLLLLFSCVEVKSLRSQKSGTLPSLLPDTKDYFQVTDELSKENSHFALSEALLSVIEQVSVCTVSLLFCYSQ